jgi:hypothetical protein
MDFTIGRKGFLTYIKSLGGSNIVKVVPANGSASGSQANGQKRLEVVCGANTSSLDNLTPSQYLEEQDTRSIGQCKVRWCINGDNNLMEE